MAFLTICRRHGLTHLRPFLKTWSQSIESNNSLSAPHQQNNHRKTPRSLWAAFQWHRLSTQSLMELQLMLSPRILALASHTTTPWEALHRKVPLVLNMPWARPSSLLVVLNTPWGSHKKRPLGLTPLEVVRRSPSLLVVLNTPWE
jgi:hypothetical protein